MSAHDSYEVLLGKLTTETPTSASDFYPLASSAPSAGRVVQRQDGTQAIDLYKESAEKFENVDTLFGATPGYQHYKKERPEHRLMLWHRLNGHNVKETAALTGYTPQTVLNVCKQPWFQEAFVRLSTEMGKDAVQTFLSGEVLPALQRTVALAVSGESEAVRLAANKEIMDRYLGKSTVKVEQKISGQVDNVVYDAAKLLEESRRLNEELKARGIGGAN